MAEAEAETSLTMSNQAIKIIIRILIVIKMFQDSATVINIKMAPHLLIKEFKAILVVVE